MAFADGTAFAVLSAICNGSFGSVSKLEAVKDNGVTPHLLNFFAGLGACISGLILTVYLRSLVRTRVHAPVRHGLAVTSGLVSHYATYSSDKLRLPSGCAHRAELVSVYARHLGASTPLSLSQVWLALVAGTEAPAILAAALHTLGPPQRRGLLTLPGKLVFRHSAARQRCDSHRHLVRRRHGGVLPLWRRR